MTMSQSSAGQPGLALPLDDPERTTVPTVKGPEGTSAASLPMADTGCTTGAGWGRGR